MLLRPGRNLRLLLLPFLLQSASSHAQTASTTTSEEIEQLRETVRALQSRVAALEAEHGAEHDRKHGDGGSNHDGPEAAAALSTAANELKASGEGPPVTSASVTQTPGGGGAKLPSVLPTQLPGGATLNYLFDGYYEYNFNQPIGRVNYLRAYDVLSNSFSLNQAVLVLDHPPNPAA